MYKTVFDEIKAIRRGQDTSLLTGNDRYSVLVDEPDGSSTAYYYSTPIFTENGELVERKFKIGNRIIEFDGSSAKIKIMRDIVMVSKQGYCIIRLNDLIKHYDEFKVMYEKATVFPTLNGVAIKAICSSDDPFVFYITTDRAPFIIKGNSRSFAFMSDEFTPVFTISVIGALKNSCVVESATISYKELGDKDYCISVFPDSDVGMEVLFEINSYEPKLFHDTTVESKHPSMCNPYGSAAYLGITPYAGEQWMYSRLDNSKLFSLSDKEIVSARLYIPKLCEANSNLSLFESSERFCSMGSDWNTKTPPGRLIVESYNFDNYLVFDLTSEFVDFEKENSFLMNGVVMVPPQTSSGVALATADNYICPQVLALNYYPV